MSMNKYISGIINCLDTVPSLKKKLVEAFKKVETDVSGKQDAIKSAPFSGVTTASGNLLINSSKIKVVSVALEQNNICADPYYNIGGTYIHCLDVSTSYTVINAQTVSGTVYYIE